MDVPIRTMCPACEGFGTSKGKTCNMCGGRKILTDKQVQSMYGNHKQPDQPQGGPEAGEVSHEQS